ncbi:DUF1254 domain-containing protein [Pseudooceanicola sp. 216_PA32_1]|uniref:DUF1254 domain-containing protein n=1 Tax=Pseudooceanicola pacificus TaxID=2676438 RepID=A0A844VZ26_9RHOB|nr:DUF1254 domain-containing protein [Pseudooceanicola pacificus]MWB76647.1 DUF1254 domain-containing protein [Pseudooceanicola pacificus]
MPEDMTTLDLRSIAREAYIYTLPLVAMESFRRRRMALGPMNDMMHARKLLHFKSRLITAPNNDTLYSNAWLDLRRGPAVVSLPETGERYFSLAVMDMWTDNLAILGTRTTGSSGGRFTIIGPDAPTEGIEGPIVRSTTPICWILARILVSGPEDLAAARKVQDALTLDMPPPPNDLGGDPAGGTRSAPWQDYFAQAADLLALHRPPATDTGLLSRIAPLGLVHGFDPSHFSPREAEEIAAGVAEARRSIEGGMIMSEGDGWLQPKTGLGFYNQDYQFRASVAVGGLGALTLEEATYFPAYSFGGTALDGRRPMRWHIPADRPIPVNGFWSLSMYEPTEDGELYFIDNPLSRYAIGDRTPGLQRNADGSLDIWIGHDSPGPDRESNWLPAPAGRYTLLLRAYLAKSELLEKRYAIPEPQPATLEEETPK